jgi:hypothetical protein
VLIGQIVPSTDVHFCRRPRHRGVQADDQWRGLGRIVRFRNVEQVSARLTRGDDGPIGLIADGNPGHNRQDESHRKTDDDHQYTEDDLFPFTFHVWTGIPDFGFAVVHWVPSLYQGQTAMAAQLALLPCGLQFAIAPGMNLSA